MNLQLYLLFDYVVSCSPLNNPENGKTSCSLGDDNVTSYEDTCSFTCNTGYELTGSDTRTCQSDGSWSSSRTQCNIRHCPNIATLVPNSRPCDTSYNSTCMVECEDGYNRSGESSLYSCDLNGTEVVWMFTGSGVTCSPGDAILSFDIRNCFNYCSTLQYHASVSVIQRMVM